MYRGRTDPDDQQQLLRVLAAPGGSLSMLSTVVQVLLCTIAAVQGYKSFGINVRKPLLHSTELFAGKHHARYGNFLDAVPRPKDPKMEEVYSRLGIKESTSDSMQTGDELRKNRTRNLKVAQFEFPVILDPPIVMQRNWSEEEISTAMECLNLSYGKKSREELTDSERIGLINWSEFDKHAETLIKDYNIPLTKKKVVTWIKFHIKKRDVRLVVETWMWSPDRPGRKRLPKPKPVKVIADLEKIDQ